MDPLMSELQQLGLMTGLPVRRQWRLWQRPRGPGQRLPGNDVNVGSGGSCAAFGMSPNLSRQSPCEASITITCVATLPWPPLHFNLCVYLSLLLFI